MLKNNRDTTNQKLCSNEIQLIKKKPSEKYIEDQLMKRSAEGPNTLLPK